MLAIKRVKDIMAGKKFPPTSMPGNDSRGPTVVYGGNSMVIPRGDSHDTYGHHGGEMRTFVPPGGYPNPSGDHELCVNAPSDPGGQYGVTIHFPQHQNQYSHPHSQGGYNHPGQYPGTPQHNPPQQQPSGTGGSVHYRPDVVAVTVRPPGSGRGRPQDPIEEPIYGTYHTFHPDHRGSHIYTNGPPLSLGALPPRAQQYPGGMQQRSLDDGDITPTNDTVSYEGGGTLPRPRGGAGRLRPVAKVVAKTRVDVHEPPASLGEKNLKNLNNAICSEIGERFLPPGGGGSASTNNTPQGTPKKMPPPPPRRSNSISESTKDCSSNSYLRGNRGRGLSYGYMGVKNNLQPDVTPDLPPPPPAPQDSGNHQHLLGDDFPPPPPPLTCITMASAARGGSVNTTVTANTCTSNNNEGVDSGETECGTPTMSGFRARRNDSNASFKVFEVT